MKVTAREIFRVVRENPHASERPSPGAPTFVREPPLSRAARQLRPIDAAARHTPSRGLEVDMRSVTLALAGVLAATLTTAPRAAGPITVSTAKVTVNGNSTLHPWTASSSTLTVTAIEFAAGGEGNV